MAKKKKKKTNKEDVVAVSKSRTEETKNGFSTTLLEKVAVFGDSGWALLNSSIVLCIAVAVTLVLDEDGSTNNADISQGNGPPMTQQQILMAHEEEDRQRDFDDLYKKLGPIPELDPPRVYSIGVDGGDSMEEISEAYKKDGVVAVRGLIPEGLLNRLDIESRQLVAKEQERKHSSSKNNSSKRPQQSMQFHTMYQSPAFLTVPYLSHNLPDINGTVNDGSTIQNNIQNITAFLEVAALSPVPTFGAALLSPELHAGETVRMIRDIFLAKDAEEFICGWHVDDYGFFPATPSSPGINAWIALDDMPAAGGGGFALAVGSHEASWREEAHHVTGATTTFPANGYQSAADMFANRTGSGTCNVQTAAPHLYHRMEDTKRIYELKRGDIIFHQRWLFHRTVAFEREYVAERKDKNLLYRRYSVRFVPGSAIIPPGYGTELSVLYDERNGNRTADKVSELDSPWYPQVFPSASTKELQDLNDLIVNKIPIAQERKIARQKEMQPFLKEAAAKQRKKKR